jgi:hypothetical protein
MPIGNHDKASSADNERKVQLQRYSICCFPFLANKRDNPVGQRGKGIIGNRLCSVAKIKWNLDVSPAESQ